MTSFRSRQLNKIIKPEDSTSGTNPTVNNLNKCCDGACFQCLMDCIRFRETNCGTPTNDPLDGCNDIGDSGRACGPYQIWQHYFQDICGPAGPCSDGDGGYAPECCDICTTPNYIQSLCTPCLGEPDSQEYQQCCQTKKERSEHLIHCWQRRYTRNPASCRDSEGKKCQCKGTEKHSDGGHPCCTCEDIARMHNGGTCGHCKGSTDCYWEHSSDCPGECQGVKDCMEQHCPNIAKCCVDRKSGNPSDCTGDGHQVERNMAPGDRTSLNDFMSQFRGKSNKNGGTRRTNGNGGTSSGMGGTRSTGGRSTGGRSTGGNY